MSGKERLDAKHEIFAYTKMKKGATRSEVITSTDSSPAMFPNPDFKINSNENETTLRISR